MIYDLKLIIGIMIIDATVEIVAEVEPVPPDGCNTGTTLVIPPPDDWMEVEVIMGFRVWQLMFLALAGLITLIVILCCFMKCRVPRTKQEIEADFKRREITRRFRFLLDRVQIEDNSLRTAIEKVNELYTNREKMKRRKKKKIEDEEEIISQGSSYLFEDEKLTIKEKIKKLLGLLDEEASDIDSMKETTDKSEEVFKRSTSVDDELSSLPDIKIIDSMKKQTSEESSDSPKLGESKVSLLLDSPARTHDTLSRLSFLQDSPPQQVLSLLQDTPPGKKFSSKKTDSQESHDSEQSIKKQDSLDSDKSPRVLLKQQKSDSQSSDGEKLLKKCKSDSQESGNEKKQKSDSQDSNDSDIVYSKPKIKKIVELQGSKLSRRESVSGDSGVGSFQKWRKSTKNQSDNDSKNTQSLDVNMGS
ncbi:uncharacterized protein DDB_G0280579-like [Parasteatoda tepidariorum]|uniref:uncharacterized protein DDB_G0280579-like n=1 Tax=Parasteatoda tepidariorum TaxID=114398 RepID=UPI001C717C75|nr:dentin sialophosphoprotein-like [Parasteatoda tepidariorum]